MARRSSVPATRGSDGEAGEAGEAPSTMILRSSWPTTMSSGPSGGAMGGSASGSTGR